MLGPAGYIYPRYVIPLRPGQGLLRLKSEQVCVAVETACIVLRDEKMLGMCSFTLAYSHERIVHVHH